MYCLTSTVAMHLLSSFRSVKIGLLVGIGGGIPSWDVDIRLADVVVGLSTSHSRNGGVVQYDLGKATRRGKLERTGSLNRPPQALATAVSKLQAIHRMEGIKLSKYVDAIETRYPNMRGSCTSHDRVDQLFHTRYHHVDDRDSCSNCDTSRLFHRQARKSKEPVVHYGKIASGNQVVKNSDVRDSLGLELGASCVEMEAAGLANNYPCLVIRGICDYADSHKNKQWQQYAAAVAAAYAKELSLVTSHTSTGRSGTILTRISDEVGDISRWHNPQYKTTEMDCLQSLRPTNRDTPHALQQFYIWYSMECNFRKQGIQQLVSWKADQSPPWLHGLREN
ncbi:nucleoside phosphorylase domain-containing protein [Aspergillus filifer]